MLSQQEILNQQMLQMQQLQMANQQRIHQSQPILNPQQQPVSGQRPMSQQTVRPVSQQVGPITQQVGPQTQQIQAPIVQQVMQQQHAQQTAQLHQQYVSQQQNGIQYVHLSNGMLMPMVAQQGQQSQQQPQVAPQTVAQQNYIVPNQEPAQPQTNNANSSKPVSSSNKHTYSSISEPKKPKTGISDSKNAQRAQLAISQDAGLKCSQI